MEEKDKVEEKDAAAGDESGSDKEIVKEWRTHSRGLEQGTVKTLKLLTFEPNSYCVSQIILV